jgi:uncharacterized protein involved in response to NO
MSILLADNAELKCGNVPVLAFGCVIPEILLVCSMKLLLAALTLLVAVTRVDKLDTLVTPLIAIIEFAVFHIPCATFATGLTK